MYRPLALFIGLRYTRTRRREKFISFVSLISLLGMVLGVFALIVVMSVMNGFEAELRQRILALVPHGYLDAPNLRLQEWETLAGRVDAHPEVIGSAPYIGGTAMLGRGSIIQGVQLTAIAPDRERAVSTIDEHMVAGRIDALQPGAWQIVVGDILARQLGVIVGDSVTVIERDPLPEEPVGAHEQDRDDDEERHRRAVLRPDQRHGDALREPHDQPAENRPVDVADAAQDRGGEERQQQVEAELRLRLASAHLAERESREALIALNQVFSLVQDQGGDTDNPALRRTRALAYLQLDRPEDAVEDLIVATRNAPDAAFSWVLLGSANMDMENYAEAVEAFDTAVRLEPDFDAGWIGRSAAFVELGLTEEAVSDAHQAVVLSPESADALNALCWALVKDNRASEGLDICDAAVEADPDSGAIVHSKAAALEQIGREREARRLYARAYELDPDSEQITEDYERTRRN